MALVEGHHLGGDCLNVGCVPSKGVIRASRMVAEARRAAKELGLPLADDATPDFGLVMQRMRRIRAQISSEDAATRYRDELGVDVFLKNESQNPSGSFKDRGLAMGVALGAAIDHERLGVYISLGMFVGLIVGCVIDMNARRKLGD